MQNTSEIDNIVFRAIANCTYDWEAWHKADGTLLWVNAAVERITGFSPEECLEMPDYPLPLVAKADRQKVSNIIKDATLGGTGNDIDFEIAHRNQTSCWGAVSWQPMYDQMGAHLGFRASVRDITERRQLRNKIRLYNHHLEQVVQDRTAKIAHLEEQRLKMEKLAALGQMAAGVAHEINNPLAGIRNAFTLFKNNLHPNDENFELLELIDSEIERISSITHQMYQLYNPNQQISRRFDLRGTVADVVKLIEPLARKEGVQIESVLEQVVAEGILGPTEVILRESELKQILLNVMRNAIQATPRNTQITIKLSTSLDSATCVVYDQGPGVPDQIAPRIFEPFFSTKTGTREGMGLGLSVSRSLAEAMSGTISIANNSTGGACVTVCLPRRLSDNE